MQITINSRTDTDHYFHTGTSCILFFGTDRSLPVMVEDCMAVERGTSMVHGIYEVPDGSELAKIMGGEIALYIPGYAGCYSAAEVSTMFRKVA